MGQCLFRSTTLSPEVSVKDVSLQRLDFTKGGTLNVTMEIYNPNPSPLEVRRVSYKISKKSDATMIVDGSNSKVFAVAGKSNESTIIPADFTYSGVAAAGASVLRRGKTDLLIEGEVTVNSKIAGDVVLPYRDDVSVEFE